MTGQNLTIDNIDNNLNNHDSEPNENERFNKGTNHGVQKKVKLEFPQDGGIEALRAFKSGLLFAVTEHKISDDIMSQEPVKQLLKAEAIKRADIIALSNQPEVLRRLFLHKDGIHAIKQGLISLPDLTLDENEVPYPMGILDKLLANKAQVLRYVTSDGDHPYTIKHCRGMSEDKLDAIKTKINADVNTTLASKEKPDFSNFSRRPRPSRQQ